MENGYVSQIQLPNNETYDIKDKNAVKDITSSDISGNVSFVKGEETKDILVKDFGTAYGIDCYKGKLPLDFTSPSGVIDEWKIYGNSSGPAEVIETQSTLPVSIDTYGGNAVDWEIYGNNNPVIETESNTLPIDISSSGGNAIDYTIYGNDDNGTENLITDVIANCGINDIGTLVSSPAWQMFCAKIKNGQQYTIVSDNVVYGFYLTKPEINATAYDSTRYAPGGTTKTFTSDIDGWIAIRLAAAQSDVVMLVKGSTAPDHYIPYQKGVGERTENELKLTAYSQTIRDVVVTVDRDAGTVKVKGLASGLVAYKLGSVTLGAGTYRLQGCASGGSYNSYRLDLRTSPSAVYDNVADNGEGAIFTVDSEMTLDVYIRCASGVDYDVTFYPLIKSGTGAINFVPYGYQIPLTISQQGQTDKTADIYIGSSPLTQGQTITKSQSNVDLELFNGDNIIDTNLYNKPNISITYNSSVLGVGEKTENLFDKDNREGIEDSYYIDRTTGNRVRDYAYYISAPIPVNSNNTYCWTFRISSAGTVHGAPTVGFFDASDNQIGIAPHGVGITQFLFTTPANCAYIRASVYKNDASTAMLTKGSTPPSEYIPFGYQIPLLVTSGQQSTPYNFYIGDSPLTEGQSISKTSTGTEIALYQGENTISTTLGNKPEMKIDYLSTEVGVGERTKNLFDIVQWLKNSTCYSCTMTSTPTSFTLTSTAFDYRIGWAYRAPHTVVYGVRATYVQVEENQTYTLTVKPCPKCYITFVDSSNEVLNSDFIRLPITNEREDYTFTTPTGCAYILLRLGNEGTAGSTTTFSDIMLVKGSTPPETYIPYGYQIPIDIKQGDEVVDHKDIYIGTQPLVEGDYINQTGVYRRLQQFVNYVNSTALPNYNFIPITEQLIAGNGENTITTSLVNNTTIDVELHPTEQASWICDKLEGLQRRIDNVDSTLGAPERRNYLVTWCSEDRLTGSTANLDFSFNNKDNGYSTFLIDGKSTATSAFIETINLLQMINGTAQAGAYNYTVARPGKYVVVIFGVEMEDSSSNIITLKIIRDNVVIASQQLINEYVGCIPFEIPNDLYGNNTIIQIEVNSTIGWTDLSFGVGIAVLNATMLLQDGNLKTDTMAIGNFSMYDSYIQLLRSHRDLEGKCTTLENKCTTLENEYDQLANESVKDITIYSDYTSTIPSGLNIDISQYKNKIKYIDIYFTDNNYRKGEVYPYNILAENFGYLRVPYGQIYTGASADEATRLSLSLIGDENSYYIRRELFYVSTDYEQEHLFFSHYSSVPGLIFQFVGTPTNDWSDFSVKGKASEVIKIYEVHLIVSP